MISEIRRLLKDSRIRYLIAGGSAALIEYAAFLLIDGLTSQLLFSNVVSFIIGLLVSFMLHKTWSFAGEHSYNGNKQLLAYAVLAIINSILSSIIIYLLVNSVGLPPWIAKVACMGMITIWNYLILNRLIFRRSNQ